MLKQEEELRRELDETVMERETALQRLSMGMAEAEERAAQLARDKEELLKNLKVIHRRYMAARP